MPGRGGASAPPPPPARGLSPPLPRRRQGDRRPHGLQPSVLQRHTPPAANSPCDQETVAAAAPRQPPADNSQPSARVLHLWRTAQAVCFDIDCALSWGWGAETATQEGCPPARSGAQPRRRPNHQPPTAAPAGTVARNDQLDLLAEFMGVGEQVAAITNSVRGAGAGLRAGPGRRRRRSHACCGARLAATLAGQLPPPLPVFRLPMAAAASPCAAWCSAVLQAMDGSMSLEAALEKRLEVINCTPADIQAFLKAHPPDSRLTPVHRRRRRACTRGVQRAGGELLAVACRSALEQGRLPPPAPAGRPRAHPGPADPRHRCLPHQVLFLGWGKAAGGAGALAGGAGLCGGRPMQHRPTCTPTPAPIARPPCSGGFRELCLPIARELGVPLSNLFANRMNFQVDDETGAVTGWAAAGPAALGLLAVRAAGQPAATAAWLPCGVSSGAGRPTGAAACAGAPAHAQWALC